MKSANARVRATEHVPHGGNTEKSLHVRVVGHRPQRILEEDERGCPFPGSIQIRVEESIMGTPPINPLESPETLDLELPSRKGSRLPVPPFRRDLL